MSKKTAPEVETFARIKVVGCGGGGGNAINHMVSSKVQGIEFIAVNTDAQDLHNSLAKKRIHIGKNLTKGLGTGMDPELGRRAAEETREEIVESLKGSDMVFITAGMGGGTGSGSSAVVANIARELGALTVGVVTKPFAFEGAKRMNVAMTAIANLRTQVDALIIIPNQRLIEISGKDILAKQAFAMADEVLREAVEGVSDLITMPGDINLDFADLKAVLEDAGSALMGVGRAAGDKRAEEAAKIAINSPLLDVSISGARGVLFAIAGNDDITLSEIHDAAQVITDSIDPDAKVIFGTVRDERIKKGEIKVTVVASGFPEDKIMEAPSTAQLFNFARKKLEQATPKEDDKVIYNAVTTPKEEIFTPEPEISQTSGENQDEEWGSVPAFLRRNRK